MPVVISDRLKINGKDYSYVSTDTTDGSPELGNLYGDDGKLVIKIPSEKLAIVNKEVNEASRNAYDDKGHSRQDHIELGPDTELGRQVAKAKNITLEINGKPAFTSSGWDYGASAGTYKVDDKTTMAGIMISGVEFTPANGGPAMRVTLTQSENAKGSTYTVTAPGGKNLGNFPRGAFEAIEKQGIPASPDLPEAAPEPVAYKAAAGLLHHLATEVAHAGANGLLVGAASHAPATAPAKNGIQVC